MTNNEIYLFEHKPFKPLPEGLNGDVLKEFKHFLNNVWQKYKEEKPAYWRECLFVDENEYDDEIKKTQKFLIIQDGKVKSRNYVGYIKFKDFEFNLYPKICAPKDNAELEEEGRERISTMLLLWLKYSNNVVLPKLDTELKACKDCDFIEILIYLFAKYTSDLLSVSIYQHYEEISEETTFLKGKLNFTEYIKNLASGKSHKFHCTYDSFEVNNKFNQIIKYVAKCLYEISGNQDTKNYLQDIIYTLDEVDDVVCTINDCESVYINRFMGDFNTVLDYCKLFLEHSITFNDGGDFNNFAFLLRTEVLFEDFISNISAKYFKNIHAQVQEPLDDKAKFYIRPDLIVGDKNNLTRIIDVKYKDVNEYAKVSQADIYQCVTYAIKKHCNNVTLLYPNFGSIVKGIDQIQIENITISFKFIDCCCSSDNDTKSLDKYEEYLKKQLEEILS